MSDVVTTDLETFTAMLDRAGLRYTVDRDLSGYGGHADPPPEGSTIIVVSGQGDTVDGAWREQHHPGGYSGFFSEVIFGAAGELWAVWAWE